MGKKLVGELTKPLPGVNAQLRLSPSVRQNTQPNTRARNSAVLIVLYPFNKKVHTLFIKRGDYNGVHSGQVSLPGGMYKITDLFLKNTALRETKEETGIPVNHIKIIGRLTFLYIPVSNIRVFPFVGLCINKPELKHDPLEVKYIIECSLDELSDPLNQKFKNMKIGENEIEIPYFDIRGDHIWGATAMIMSEFLEVVKKM